MFGEKGLSRGIELQQFSSGKDLFRKCNKISFFNGGDRAVLLAIKLPLYAHRTTQITAHIGCQINARRKSPEDIVFINYILLEESVIFLFELLIFFKVIIILIKDVHGMGRRKCYLIHQNYTTVGYLFQLMLFSGG